MSGSTWGSTRPVRPRSTRPADSGKTTIAAPIVRQDETQVTGRPVDPELAMVTPVYDQSMFHDTVAGRQAALLGFTTTSFRPSDFFEANDPSIGRAIHWAVYDEPTGDRLYRSAAATDSLIAQRSVEVLSGRKWTVRVEPADGFVSASSKLSPYLAAAVVLAGALVLAFLAWWVALGRDRLTRQVDSAVAARTAAEQRFRAAFEDAPIGVALLDLEGNVLTANAAAALIAGRGVPELVGLNVLELMDDSTRHEATPRRAVDHRQGASQQPLRVRAPAPRRRRPAVPRVGWSLRRPDRRQPQPAHPPRGHLGRAHPGAGP